MNRPLRSSWSPPPLIADFGRGQTPTGDHQIFVELHRDAPTPVVDIASE